MSKPSVIDVMPAPIRAALMQRIIDDGYGNYLAISVWLKEQGFTLSKSALHRFGKELKDMRTETHLDALRRTIDRSDALVDLRMRCLESATASEPHDAFGAAKRYLEWVLSGEQ